MFVHICVHMCGKFYLYHVYLGCIRFVTSPSGAKHPTASRQMGYSSNRRDTNGLYPFSDRLMYFYLNFGCNKFNKTFFSVHRELARDNCGPPKKSVHPKTLLLLKQQLNTPIYRKVP